MKYCYVDAGNCKYNQSKFGNTNVGATDIEGGAKYEYQLILVLMLSLAILLQTLAARLGLVTGL